MVSNIFNFDPRPNSVNFDPDGEFQLVDLDRSNLRSQKFRSSLRLWEHPPTTNETMSLMRESFQPLLTSVSFLGIRLETKLRQTVQI